MMLFPRAKDHLTNTLTSDMASPLLCCWLSLSKKLPKPIGVAICSCPCQRWKMNPIVEDTKQGMLNTGEVAFPSETCPNWSPKAKWSTLKMHTQAGWYGLKVSHLAMHMYVCTYMHAMMIIREIRGHMFKGEQRGVYGRKEKRGMQLNYNPKVKNK